MGSDQCSTSTIQARVLASTTPEIRQPLRRKPSPTYRTLRDLHRASLSVRVVPTFSRAGKEAIHPMHSEEALRKIYEDQLMLYLNSCYDDLEDIEDASDDEEAIGAPKMPRG